jgi:hypothetical protein
MTALELTQLRKKHRNKARRARSKANRAEAKKARDGDATGNADSIPEEQKRVECKDKRAYLVHPKYSLGPYKRFSKLYGVLKYQRPVVGLTIITPTIKDID